MSLVQVLGDKCLKVLEHAKSAPIGVSCVLRLNGEGFCRTNY